MGEKPRESRSEQPVDWQNTPLTYGTKVKVKRSSGRLEEGWIVGAEGKEIGEVEVINVAQDVKKMVSIKELRSWQ